MPMVLLSKLNVTLLSFGETVESLQPEVFVLWETLVQLHETLEYM